MAIRVKYLLLYSLLFLWGCGDEMVSGPEGGATLPTDQVNNAYKKILNVKFASVPTSEQQITMRSEVSPYTGFEGFDELTQRFGKIVRMERIFSPAGKYEPKLHACGLDRWYQIEFQDEVDLSKAISFYSSLSEIEYIQPEYKVTFDDYTVADGGYLPTGTKAWALPCDDPGLNKQWHYDSVGVSVAQGADIGLFKGWQATTGDSSVIVAVLDQGVDYKHEDLADNMWVNKGEIPGNKIDDDGNGYVDDVYGFNFYSNRGAITGCEHGTHVAGTIAAVNNNGKGVCGIAGGSGHKDGVRIMSCQIGEDYSDIIGYRDALIYAANNGAVIAQCSWYLQREDQAFKEAIDYFVKNAGSGAGSPMKGGIIFFAAGNNRTSVGPFPPAYSAVVSVAATNQYRKKASYSNYGDWVKITAPGGEKTPTEMGIYSTLPNNRYGYMNGTSQACPHASGIAALIVSAHAGIDFTNEKLKEIIYNSTADLSNTEPEYYASMGKGLFRADLALWHDDGVAPQPVTDLVPEAKGNQIGFTWTQPTDPNDGRPVYVHLYVSSDSLTPANLSAAEKYVISVKDKKPGESVSHTINLYDEGKYYYAVTTLDTWGNVSPLSNVVSYTYVIPSTALSLVLYPNPVIKVMNVSWNAAGKAEKMVSVYDLSGRKVFQETMGKNVEIGKKELDLSGLSAGKYVVKFRHEKGEIVRNILKAR